MCVWVVQYLVCPCTTGLYLWSIRSHGTPVTWSRLFGLWVGEGGLRRRAGVFPLFHLLRWRMTDREGNTLRLSTPSHYCLSASTLPPFNTRLPLPTPSLPPTLLQHSPTPLTQASPQTFLTFFHQTPFLPPNLKTSSSVSLSLLQGHLLLLIGCLFWKCVLIGWDLWRCGLVG